MKQWFALLVQPRKEKVVEKELLKNGFENYLPCKKELHQWSDRRKLVSVVVIPSYIFVRIDPKEMYNVLILPHTVRFIFFEKKPAPIPDVQIQSLRILLESQAEVFVQDRNFAVGDKIRFVHGKFTGVEGIILEESNNKHKFIIRLDSIGMDLVANISAEDLVNAEKIE